MSKISSDQVREAVHEIYEVYKNKKYHRFVETIELQVQLKGYEKKDKRFSGSVQLQNDVKLNTPVCVIADARLAQVCAANNIRHITVDDLKALKDNKEVKKLIKSADVFFMAPSMAKDIRKYCGSMFNRAHKYPTPVPNPAQIASKVDAVNKTVNFTLRKTFGLHTAVGNMNLTEEQAVSNILRSINYLVSLLKKKWQNIDTVHIKSTQFKTENRTAVRLC
eukprot:TRINITY_DN3019_c0_g1_i1.p1 TRINITY_DN3019_c0_g1~~TRINITY_DN3019_c0_g1_i1.p1  ORF type:complete len:221 (+),score=31.53 TRINITY_DN3019_c0_g1_i1:36-698(+)